MNKGKGFQRYASEMNKIIAELLDHPTKYFDKNLVLNSEGVKLLSRLAKMVIQVCPELRPSVAETRKKPDYESIAKFCSMIRESRCLEKAFKAD